MFDPHHDDSQTKRLILALVFFAGIYAAWTLLFPQPKMEPQPKAPQTEQAAPPASGAGTGISEQVKPLPFTPVEGKPIVITTPLYQATLNSAGGNLTDFELSAYKQTIAVDSPAVNLVSEKSRAAGPMALLWNGQNLSRTGQWSQASAEKATVSVEKGKSGEVVLQGMLGDIAITRTLSFTADNYLINEKVVLQNTGSTPLSGRLSFPLSSEQFGTGNEDRQNATRVAWMDVDGMDDEADTDDLSGGLKKDAGVLWGAVKNNYFTLAVAPEPGDVTLHFRHQQGLYRLQADKNNIDLAPGAAATIETNYYLGPVIPKYLDSAPNDLSRLVHYGFFDIIARYALIVLNFFYGLVGNWGVAIILLTICVKLVFWPLANKSYKSMSQMKKLQPHMAKIREQYKDNREKMNAEIMQLYKTYKVNPMGGCLPMLVQIPIFIGLYQALFGAIELRHAPFIATIPFTDIIWLADLSVKDPYYITPLIMGGTMFLQQWLTPAPGDPMQAKIMLFMPVVFTFIFLNFPAGLVLYWLVNNIFSIAQQWVIVRRA